MKKIVSFTSIVIACIILHSVGFAQGGGHFTIGLSDTMRYQAQLGRDYSRTNGSQALPAKVHYDNLSDSIESKTFFIDTGFLNDDSNTNFDLYITNLSDTPLVFSQVYWIEPNFKPDVSYKPLSKGESTRLRYTCVARQRPGRFVKSARIMTTLGSFNLRFSGTILPPGMAIDKAISTGTAVAGGSYHAVFRIYNNTDDDMTIDSLLQATQSPSIAYADKEQEINPDLICAHGFRTFKVTMYPQEPGRFVSKTSVVVNGTKVEHMLLLNVKPQKGKKK